MRVTVFGASGMLGQAVVRALAGNEVTPLSSKDADLRDATRVQQSVRESRPDWIILAAAFTDVDRCESERELALAVNCEGAIHVAEAARANSARLIFISSDYVFDGSKRTPYETGDARNPINVYGQSKAFAEERLLEILPEVCIVRTSWLFGPGVRCFPATILKLAATRPEIAVVNDQRGCPTYTPDLAAALVQLCERSAHGILHATNSGDCTWYDLACELLRQSGSGTRVKAVSTSEFPRPAKRPPYSVLSGKSLESLGIRMPHWTDSVRRYLKDAVGTS